MGKKYPKLEKQYIWGIMQSALLATASDTSLLVVSSQQEKAQIRS